MLPDEILLQIFNNLDFYSQYPNLPLVCKKWRRVLFGIKTLIVKATPRVEAKGLQRILEDYKYLETLYILPDLDIPVPVSRRLLDIVALQLVYHPTVMKIHCASDNALEKMFNGCPSLKMLDFPQVYSPGVLSPTTMPYRHPRNLLSFFRTNLEMLSIENAIFVPLPLEIKSCLRHLCVSFPDQDTSSLLNMFEFLDSHANSLPHLSSLRLLGSLEIDMPKNFMSSLRRACPQLKTLEMLECVVTGDFLQWEMPLLVCLKFENCVFYHPVENFRSTCLDLVYHVLREIPTLQTFHLALCDMMPSDFPPTEIHYTSSAILKSLVLSSRHCPPLSIKQVQAVFRCFPNLEHLELDMNENQHDVWASISHNMQKLNRLRLTFPDGYFDDEDIFAPTFSPPRLQELTIKGYHQFPIPFISETCQNITRLKLIKLTNSLSEDDFPSISFPHLKFLELQSQTHFGHDICLQTFWFLTRNSQSLTTLIMDASCSLQTGFSLKMDDLQKLVKRCPKLVELKTVRFTFPRSTLQALRRKLQHLEHMEVLGENAIPADDLFEWEKGELAPFLEDRFLMRTLILYIGLNKICDQDALKRLEGDVAMSKKLNRRWKWITTFILRSSSRMLTIL